MKNQALVLFTAATAALGVVTLPAWSQSIIPGVAGTTNPSVQAPTAASGRSTENLSVTNGSRTTLSVGNSTSFGANTNLSSSAGLVSVSRSVLIPSSIGIESSIGSGQILGKTTINISNLTAKGGGEILPGSGSGTSSGSKINSTDGQFASGNALIDGMQASVKMDIGANGEASFFSTVHPTLHDAATGCAPNASGTGACAFDPVTDLVSGNASAAANLSTTTNIDIQASQFTQTFAQSF
jgi:hypothetical protein